MALVVIVAPRQHDGTARDDEGFQSWRQRLIDHPVHDTVAALSEHLRAERVQ